MMVAGSTPPRSRNTTRRATSSSSTSRRNPAASRLSSRSSVPPDQRCGSSMAAPMPDTLLRERFIISDYDRAALTTGTGHSAAFGWNFPQDVEPLLQLHLHRQRERGVLQRRDSQERKSLHPQRQCEHRPRQVEAPGRPPVPRPPPQCHRRLRHLRGQRNPALLRRPHRTLLPLPARPSDQRDGVRPLGSQHAPLQTAREPRADRQRLPRPQFPGRRGRHASAHRRRMALHQRRRQHPLEPQC